MLKKNCTLDFSLVFILVCLSGNMVFLAGGRDTVPLSIFSLFLAILMSYQLPTIHKRFLLVVGIFAVIFINQALFFSFLPVITISGFFVKLFIAYGVMRLVHDFPKIYVYVMMFVSIMSFVFYFPDRLMDMFGMDIRLRFLPLAELLDVPAYGINDRINIGFHNFQTGGNASRNAAMFWEPGAFAGYLILALIFLSTCWYRLPTFVAKIALLVFVTAILTTQSTMGLVVLPFVLLLLLRIKFSTFKSASNSLVLILISIILLVFFSLIAAEVNFIGGKIVHLYEIGVNHVPGWQTSRFGAMIFDAEYISQRPLTGWGLSLETQFQLNEDMERIVLGNGMTGFIRQMGLLGMGVFLYTLWLGLRQLGLSKTRMIFTSCILLLTLNGEYFLSHPLFMGLMFLPGRRGRSTIHADMPCCQTWIPKMEHFSKVE